MNLELCRTFYFVAQSGSISKAAENLFITQPAVSRAVRQLEEAMGCPLFLRTSKGVKLTVEGKILYHHVEQAFNFITAAEKKINDVKSLYGGEIRIGVSDTLCKHYLMPFLKLFNTLHPGVKIHVVCPTTPGIVALLKGGMIDFGIINMPFHDNQLVFKEMLEIQDCFVVGKKYSYLCHQVQPLGEILKYPLLLLEKNSNSRRFIDSYFSDNNISVTPDFELGNIDLLIHFAEYDFGVACVIRNFIDDELQKGGLYEVKPVEKIPARCIGAVWLKNVPLPAAASELIGQMDSYVDSEI